MAWRGNSGSSSKSSSSGSSKKNSSGYVVAPSGLKVAANTDAGQRLMSSNSKGITSYAKVDDGDGGYVRRNADGSTTSYNSIYSTNSRSSGGGGGGSSSYQSYLSDARRSAIDAQEARTRAALDQVAGQQTDIHNSANDAAQQAYIAKEKTLMQNPQQLAALGISGGGSESALLGINTGYENNRNTIMQNRGKAIRENENQQNQIRATGDASLADIDNSFASQLAQYAAQQEQAEQQRQNQLNDIQSQRDYEQETWERNNAYSAKLASQKSAQKSSGGYSTSQVLQMYNAGLIDDSTANSMLGLGNSSTGGYLQSTNSIAGGTGGIYISGYGRLSQSEVTNLLQSGAITAYRNDDDTITYRRN